MLSILIPISRYESLDSDILSAIVTSIKIPYRVYVHSGEPTKPDRKYGIVVNRNSLRDVASSDSYNLLLDSDVILEKWVLPQLITYLDNHTEVGMCAVPTAVLPSSVKYHLKDYLHVNISCALIRGDILKKVPFRYTGVGCECLNFNEDIRNLGYEVHYITTQGLQER